jgi:signal transduction histidine kinase
MQSYKKIQPEIKITIIYFLLGFLWILFSGNLVYGISTDSEAIVDLERYKGWFFVLVTGTLLFLLIRRESKKQNKLMKQLSESREEIIEKSAILQNQNKQLKEYAFITSHNLRKPIANILGLIQIFDKNTEMDPDNKMAIENISEMASELDDLVRKSNAFIDFDPKASNEK